MSSNPDEPCCWPETILETPEAVIEQLANFRLYQNQWVFRGQTTINHYQLKPNIDRVSIENTDNADPETTRESKIKVERQIIELFRTAVKTTREEEKQIYLRDDIFTLMLIQHYGGPTRLLDWSFSPYIATFFAVSDYKCDEKDALIWAFDYQQYEETGPKQWEQFPEVKVDGVFDKRLIKAFEKDYYNNWIVCQFLSNPFPRIYAQEGLFTFCSQFDVDHAEKLKELLGNDQFIHCYKIKGGGENKKRIRRFLMDEIGIWNGTMYPDLPGVAIGITELLHDKSI